MQELRLVLIIVGVLAISALLLHGLWSSRKDKPAKFGEKPIGRLGEGKQKDTEGFDQDGIGSVRVIAGSPPAEQVPAKRSERKEPELHFGDALDVDPLLDTPVTPATAQRQENQPELEQTSDVIAPTQTASHLQTMTEEAPAQESVQESELDALPKTHAEMTTEPAPVDEPEQPTTQPTVTTAFTAESPLSSDAATSEQAEVTDAPIQAQQAELHNQPETLVEEAPVALEPDFLVLNVHARRGELLSGVKLFQCLERHHLIYGDNSVYHRHADLTGTEPVLFTVANMVSPGYFPQDQIDEFETPGIAFYLMLPCHGRADDNFNLMLQTVQRVADELSADILDHERNLITPQRLKACREKAKLYL
ncbi:cell division protein ZipA [Photobacterium sp. GJ3]|uniref:cell division protein ZipA n=1 Tax=Photobacterium sp. GJ3 TaxID=2829502 RepID=UPI001B8B413D|nr:cell division protein ZipA [Photobacterium sp. GJ3]QUJ66733.1 cell division protein ZipA [Photobacterium sp. GJ3]